jgi:hypothetical protein
MQQTDLESAINRHSWDWLVDLAPRLDIIVEMIDRLDVPVFPVGSTRDAATFRSMITSGEPTVRSAMSDVLQSKKPVFLAVDGLQAVCSSVATGGVLLVARHLKGADSAEECREDLDSIGNWLASAIEASLNPANGISVEPYRIVSFRRILHEATSRGSIRNVVGAFVEALNVWDDVRVHCYIAGAAGGFFQFGSPLTDVPSSLPDQLDEALVPAHGRMVRVSRADLDRLGLVSEPGDTLMLRILIGDMAWLLVFSGMIDNRQQVRLKVYSDILRESLHDVVLMITSRLVAELTRPELPSNADPEVAAQAALDQLTAAIGGHKAALSLTPGRGRRPLVVGHTDMLSSHSQSRGKRLAVKSSDAGSVMMVVFERDQPPFTAFEREIALAGLAVAHRYLLTEVRPQGVPGLDLSGAVERRRRHRPVDSIFDQLAAEAIATGRPASVIVVSVDASAARPGVLPLWVGRIRTQLRAGDFAGILSEREIAVLLCGASADQTAKVSARLTKMFGTAGNTDALLYSAIGMSTRSPNSSFEGSIVGAARAQTVRH